MATPLYNVPVTQLAAYRGRRVVLRGADPETLATVVAEFEPVEIACLQLMGLPAGVDPLLRQASGIPVDIVLSDPDKYPLLYRYPKLLEAHPVRVSLPVRTGFSRAVRLAAALEFAVKLEVGQPEPALIGELSEVLGFYLHHTSVAHPIDFFHELLLALCQRQPVTLWAIQEEDPAFFRQVNEQGEETGPGRLAGQASGLPESFVCDFAATQFQDNECGQCPCFDYCQGYFKWPDPRYRCNGVVTLMQQLAEAAAELARDLDAFPQGH